MQTEQQPARAKGTPINSFVSLQTLSASGILLVAFLLAPLPAAAADGIVSDVRLGVLAHDMPILGDQREHGVDLNAEVIFASPVPEAAVADVAPAWRWLLRPAPDIGITANMSGDTSQIYAGLKWSVDLDNHGRLWPDHAVFLSFGIGPSFNNGHVHTRDGDRLSLGSNVLFHPSVEIGYRFTPQWSISAYYDHSSNAGLASSNAGLNDLGIRIGYHF